MSFQPNNILTGPARVFIKSTVPTSPAWMTHTNGVPGDGFEVGYTEGPVEFTYELKKSEVNPEQSYMAVVSYTTEELPQISFTCYELTYQTILAAFDNTTTVSDGTRDGFQFGNASSIISPFNISVFFSSQQRANLGKYTIGMLYKAYNMNGVKLPFTKTKPTTYQVTMKALADTTRPVGDQGGQFFREK